MKSIVTILVIVIYTSTLSCNYNTTSNNEVFKKDIIDSTYKIIKTTKLLKGQSKTNFKINDRKRTQFNIDRESTIEVFQSFTIKISDKEVLLYNSQDELVKKYLIQKKWVDKYGPSDVYDLKDENNIDCSLDHYVSSTTDGRHYLGFRYKKVLENYSN
jgi:hypothetical protein